MRGLLVPFLLVGCAIDYTDTPADPGTGEGGTDVTGDKGLADEHCSGAPNAGPARSWRHLESTLVAELGDTHHRGVDVIALDTAPSHTLTGKIAYGPTDKALEDEDVELFGCLAARWQPLGTARTSNEGRFSLALAADERLPTGMRDLYISVVGDRSGAAFLALVAPAATRLVVSDVDGTLTASENAYPEALVLGGDVAPQPGAPTALATAARTYAVVYITARGDRFTQDTRDWFAAKRFPRGPVRLATAIVTEPGADTIEFKTSALASLAGFDVVFGIGNRDTDIAAYGSSAISPDHILIKLPEYSDEVASDLAAGKATGFTDYSALTF